MKDYEIYFAPKDGQPPVRKTIRAVSPQQAIYYFAYGFGFKGAYGLWDRIKNAPKNDRLRVTQIIDKGDLFIHD